MRTRARHELNVTQFIGNEGLKEILAIKEEDTY